METIAFVLKNRFPVNPITTFGWGNGYVAVPQGHPLFEKDYFDIEGIDIHGGLTFADYGKTLVGAPLKTAKMWVIGFDCCHHGDDLTTCPKEYVQQQAEELKKQVDSMFAER